MPSRSAFMDIVRSAIVAPDTIDAWPTDAADLVDAGERDAVESLRQLRANGGVSLVTLAFELEQRKRYADVQALSALDLSGEPLSKAAVQGAWKSMRAGRAIPAPTAPRAAVQSGDSGDLLNARRLVEWAKGTFLHAHGGTYHHWDGKRWNRDAGAAIHELAARVARSWLKDAADASTREAQDALVKHARAAQKSGAIEAMISLAGKCFPDLKIDPALFDADPWLLNVENGTIDLRTGQLRDHSPNDLITKLAPVTFDPAATAPRWERFLREVLPTDAVRAYVQRAAGYSLSGVVREHCFFMAVGAGRNGKGVLMRCLARVMGDYAATAPMDLLIAKSGADHPAELAVLEGARFVAASELPKGKWNEARLKQLTGGDTVPARGMRENYRPMRPTWKLWIATNERPRSTGNGDALWERLKEIRFPVQFRDADDPRPETQAWPVKDPKTEEVLAAELPGILRWAVEGCVTWAASGLGEPSEVRTATAEYRVTEDVLGPFLAERPITQAVKLRDLFSAWCEYAKGVNEQPGRQRDLSAALRAHGYTVKEGHAHVMHVYPIQVELKMPNGNTVLVPGVRVSGEVSKHDSQIYRATTQNSQPSIGNRPPEPHHLTSALKTSPLPLSREPGDDDGDEPDGGSGWRS